MGRPKARVLPDPVWAAPSTSRPSRSAGGRACAWTGVGAPKPAAPRAAISSGPRLQWAQAETSTGVAGACGGAAAVAGAPAAAALFLAFPFFCFLAGGVMVERGTPDEVIRNPRNPLTQEFLRRVHEAGRL